MDLNRLVELISKEVLKELQKDTKNNGPLDNKNKTVYVLALSGSIDESDLLDKIGKDFEVLYFGDDLEGRSITLHLIPKLTIETMADLAQGNSSDEISSKILRLLLSGIFVEVLDYEYRSYEDSAPHSLYQLYENQEKTLKSFGLKPFEKREPKTKSIKKELICENDIIMAGNKGIKTLMVSKGANITPLAVETAKDMNIEFIKN